MINGAKNEGEKEVREAAFSPFVEGLTRIGFGVRGLIYLVMGLIAIQVVLGVRSAPSGKQGVLELIGAQPFGRILLLIVIIGLAGYALWGVIRAIFDPLNLGTDVEGLMQRFAFLINAGIYASLIAPTYGYLTGGASASSNNSQTQQSVSTIMSMPWGRWLVGIGGIIVIGVGLAQIFKGFSHNFDKQFQLYDLNHQQSVWIKRIGRFGIVARGVVIALIGVFLALAAYNFNPEQARGIGGALTALVRQPYGPWLLAVVAAGLISFGIYSITGAAWFRLKR
jgi:hypothetical protein